MIYQPPFVELGGMAPEVEEEGESYGFKADV